MTSRSPAAERSAAWRRARGIRTRAEYEASRTRTHGLRATYNAGCHDCDECRRAEREYRAAYRARKRLTP